MMKFDINQIINNKAELLFFQNMTNSLHEDFNTGVEPEIFNYNLVQIVMEARVKFLKEINSSEYYCHTCSTDARRPVYHKVNPEFSEYKLKPVVRKNAEQLNRINEIIFE